MPTRFIAALVCLPVLAVAPAAAAPDTIRPGRAAPEVKSAPEAKP